MIIDIFQIDAFVGDKLKGNPAAVCPLNEWIDEQLMQDIAEANNLSETAFFVANSNGNFEIRWFTPKSEVNLCGHATMATSYVIYNHLGYKSDLINFNSKSGKLITKKTDEIIEMNFPKANLQKLLYDSKLEAALNHSYQELYFAGEDYLVIFNNENEIANLNPDFNQLKLFENRGVIVSATGKKVDFVSRAFFPKLNVNEDPVCGSAHTHLVPYWSKKINKINLHAKQISPRGGEIFCRLEGNRVILAGKCKLFLQGKIYLN
jgi:PhzF family phenazine biosynthesis protein